MNGGDYKKEEVAGSESWCPLVSWGWQGEVNTLLPSSLTHFTHLSI